MTDPTAGGGVRPRLWPWLLLAAALFAGGLLVGFVGVLVGSDEARAAMRLYHWAYGLVGASVLSVTFGAAWRTRVGGRTASPGPKSQSDG